MDLRILYQRDLLQQQENLAGVLRSWHALLIPLSGTKNNHEITITHIPTHTHTHTCIKQIIYF